MFGAPIAFRFVLSNEPQTIELARLAAMLDLSERRIQQLAGDGIVHRDEHGRYLLAESVTGYVRFIQRGTGEALEDLNAARARKEAALADIAEMKVAHQRGELVSSTAILHAARSAFTMVRARLLVVPQRLAPRLVGETDRRVIGDAIEEEIRASLEALSTKKVLEAHDDDAAG